MLQDVLTILLLFIVAGGIAGAILVLTHFFGPHKPGKIKLSPYESGKEPVGSPRIRFPIRFYIIAVLFVIFDIEVVFFYPWAVIYKRALSEGSYILIEMVIFIFLLLVGYLYAWKRGALEWE